MGAIIHFTKEFKTLKSILSDSAFRLHYCSEIFYLKDKASSSAVHPMVSFAEKSMKTIHVQKNTYGKYGIGLKNTWVLTNKIHPVIYLDSSSHIAKALSDLLRARRKKEEVNRQMQRQAY